MSEKNELNVKVDASGIKAEMRKLIDAENKIADLEAQHVEDQKYREYYDKNTGVGTLGLTPDMREKESNGRNNQKEFDSIEDLLEYCRLHDRESYQKIKDKTFGALQGNNFSWEDQFIKGEDGVERSLIGRTIQRLNADRRREIR